MIIKAIWEEKNMANNFFNEIKDKIPADKMEEVKDKVIDFATDKAKDVSEDVKEKISKASKEKTGSDSDIMDSLKDKLNFFGGDNK